MTPGYVPKGWRRGEALTVTEPSHPNWRGSVAQAEVPRRAKETDTSLVVFYAGDRPKLDAWLAWWNA